MSTASCTVLTGTYGDLGRRSTGYHALDGLMLVYEREWPYHTTSRRLWRCIDASEARAHTLAVHDGSGRIKLHLAVGHVKGMNIALQSTWHGEHYVVYVRMILTDRLGLGTFRSWWFIWRAWAASLDPVKDV